MPTLHDVYAGVVAESTYGTFLAPTTFTEFLSEGVNGKYERIDSEGLRAGNQVLRSDRWAVNPKGAEGEFKFEVMDTGFDFYLPYMLGASSGAAPVGGFTTYTATLGDLRGKSFSLKIGRVDSSQTIRPFDYAGGKVKSWEISNSVDGVCQCSLDLDFATENQAGAAATPTYPTFSTQLFTFARGAFTIGGTSVPIADISIKGDNKLNVDRYHLRGTSSTVKREPLVEGLREISFDVKAEFEDLTQVNRVSSATVAGALAAVTATWDSPQGGQLAISIPVARFDTSDFNVDGGAKILELGLSGKGLNDGTQQPITITYKAKSS